MRSWWMELRLAVRALARRPGFTAVAALTLALGIGANLAIFAVVHGVVLKPLSYPDPDRIVVVEHHAPGLDIPDVPQSDGTALAYQDHLAAFAAFAVVGTEGRNLAPIDGGDATRIRAGVASGGFAQVLGVVPALGRVLGEDDSRPGAPPVAMLSYPFWRDNYGADPAVLGRTLALDGVSTEIVGVLPRKFVFPSEGDGRVDVLLPVELDPDEGFGSFSNMGLARLAPGLSLSDAQREVSDFQKRFPEFIPNLQLEFLEMAQWSVTVTPLRQALVEDIATTLWILLGTVGLVLLIAAANVANLVLVRTEARRREVAVRTALGAGRGALARTFLGESVVLSALGAAMGAVLAWGALRLVLTLAPPALPRRDDIAMDGSVILFGVGLTVLAALVFGMLPLIRSRMHGLSEGLKEGLRGSTASRGALRGRNILVAGQLALALLLLAGSGLLFRSFMQLRAVDPGVDPEGVTTAVVSLDRSYLEPGAARQFYRRLVDRVSALPGVEVAGIVDDAPLSGRGMSASSFEVEGWDRPDDAPPVVALRKVITPGTLEALGITLERGRPPTWPEVEDQAPVAVVNHEFARRFLDDDPLSHRISPGDEGQLYQVIGVVGDVRELGVEEEIRPTIYWLLDAPDGQSDPQQMTLVVKGPSAAVVTPRIRAILRELDPGVPVSVVETMDEILTRDLASTSFTVILLGLSAAMALVLGTVGIYGVISYVVSQRTREMGVRMALGAAGADVRRMVVRQGMLLTVVGLAVGLVAAMLLTRVLRSVLFEVSATDPLVLALTTSLLFVVSLLASWIPALRASRVNPVEALRAE